MEDNSRPTPAPQPASGMVINRKKVIIIASAVAAVAVALIIALIVVWRTQQAKIDEAVALKEQAELDASQQQLQAAYDDLNEQFSSFENQRNITLDDSVKRDLTRKYENARLQVERLQQQLRNQRNMSAAEISKLRSEIETLRNLLRHYVEEINRLNIENQNLRTENTEIKNQNTQLSSQVAATTRRNEELSERMTLAEKLNVTGVGLVALNRKGKPEKKVEKARQLRITFTIPQNNSTPVGSKTIWLRLISPSGQVLGGGGRFTFEGASLEASAKTVIEYSGEELPGITIYWDVNTALTPGDYTVELFADNYRLCSRSFNLN